MLSMSGVSKSFSSKTVLNNINFSLKDNEVVGLIGPNGAGKTTIFKIILGEIKPDHRTVQSNENVGYLPQHPQFNNLTVQQFLESKSANSVPDYKIEKVLSLLGLEKLNRSQSADSLSGGQKTRIYLASLLLADPEPTLLLLDEPTNNLDLGGLDWLEGFIKNFKGSVLLTSHDRYFLDETVSRIVELKSGQVKNYGGNYSFYRQQKLDEEIAYLEKYKRSQTEIKKLERLIQQKRDTIRKISKDPGREHEKFERYYFKERVTRKSAAAKDALESRLDRTQRLEKPKDRISYPIGFAGSIPGDKFIIGTKDLSFHFKDNLILDKVSFVVLGKQHIWISGANGSGKTTLLKILIGKLSPGNGTVEIGPEIKVGYFSQETSLAARKDTGIDLLRKVELPDTELYKAAMNLHLGPEDLSNPISQLSRGQQVKLETVKLLLEQNNLLVLDEPTNHLEIETREEIEAALKDFQGAIIVASHDRYFLEEISIDRELRLEDGLLEEV